MITMMASLLAVAPMIVLITFVMISVVLMMEGSDAVLVMPVVSSLVMIVIRIDHVCDDYDDGVAAGGGAAARFDHAGDD